MTDTAAPVETITLIRPTRGLASLQLRAVWQYRELLFFLAWRDVMVRYNPENARGTTDRARRRVDHAAAAVEHGGVHGDLRGAARRAVERRAVCALCARRAGPLAVLRRQPEPGGHEPGPSAAPT
jgi:hypothetical protein